MTTTTTKYKYKLQWTMIHNIVKHVVYLNARVWFLGERHTHVFVTLVLYRSIRVCTIVQVRRPLVIHFPCKVQRRKCCTRFFASNVIESFLSQQRLRRVNIIEDIFKNETFVSSFKMFKRNGSLCYTYQFFFCIKNMNYFKTGKKFSLKSF